MQHVGESFSVHQAMLDRHIEQGAEWESLWPRWNRIGKCLFQFFIQDIANFTDVRPHFGNGRPGRRLIDGKAASNGINTESKQAVKFRMETLQAQNSFVEKIPVEGLQMSDIKNDAVTLSNGPFVERIRLDDSKQPVGAPAGIGELFDQIVTNSGVALRGKHLDLPGWREQTHIPKRKPHNFIKC